MPPPEPTDLDVPTTEINPAGRPEWTVMLGALFGAVALGLLGYLVIQAGGNPEFICNSYSFFVPFFALCLGLCVAFIGGNAAVKGTLGASAQNNAVSFAGGGGIAVVITAIAILFYFGPTPDGPGCKSPVPRAQLQHQLSVGPIDVKTHRFDVTDQWYRHEPTGASSWTYKLLLAQPSTADISIYGPHSVADADETCTIKVHTAAGSPSKVDAAKLLGIADPEELSGANMAGSLGKAMRAQLTLVTAVEDPVKGDYTCLAVENRITKTLIIVPATGKLYFTDQLYASFDHKAKHVPVSTGSGSSSWTLFAPAFAKSDNTFQSIYEALDNADPKVRTGGRKFLSQNYSDYKKPIENIIRKKDASPLVLSGLLHAVSAGIDEKSDGKLSPGTRRLLNSAKLPGFDVDLAELVKLTGHTDAGVQKQARRIIQRYPIDGFEKIYSDIWNQAVSGNCKFFQEDIDHEAILYGSIFYQYNRIVQIRYDKRTPSEQEVKQIDQKVQWIRQAIAKCATRPETLADVALLDYGRSLTYNTFNVAKSTKAASDFIQYLGSGRKDKYYIQRHIGLMETFSKR